MARKFTRRRWRRPERMTLEAPSVVRRKHLGPPDVLTLESDLERHAVRRRSTAMVATYVGVAIVEGVIIGLLLHTIWLTAFFALLALVYVAALRSFGGRWLVRTIRAEPARNPRLNRYTENLATTNAIATPAVLIARSDRLNGFAIGLAPNAIVATTGSLNVEDLTLEALIAHEIAHLRDGDAALSAQYVGLTGALDIARRNTVVAPFLAGVGVLLLPAATVVRLLRTSWFAADHEHRADVVAALLTRYPPGVASALRKAEGAKAPGPRSAAAFWFAPATDKRAQLIEEM